MNDFSNNYREVNIILDLLGNDLKNKLPKKLISFLNKYENKKYNPQITLDDLFNEKISKDTIVLISMLYINYWTSSKEEKEEYMELLRKKDKEYLEKNKLILHEVFPDKDLIYQKAKESINAEKKESFLSNNLFNKIINKLLKK